jgi:L-fuculose-phosphate aldolase
LVEKIKFKLELVEKIPTHPKIRDLKRWCGKFYKRGWVPWIREVSCGNLSFRVWKNEFIITGSQVGIKESLPNDCFVRVMECDLKRLMVHASGLRAPSSESMLHYAIYKQRPEVNAIFHGHSSFILRYAPKLGIIETKEKKPPGTLDLVKEVLKVLDENNFIILKEHGFLSLGKDMEGAGNLAIKIQAECEKVSRCRS